jgi:hypothetical protein
MRRLLQRNSGFLARKVQDYPRTTVQSLEFGASSAAATSASSTTGRSGTAGKSTAQTAARTVVLPAGTEISVLTNENIDSSTGKEGRHFAQILPTM